MTYWSGNTATSIEEIAPSLHMITSTREAKTGVGRKHAYLLQTRLGNLLFHGPNLPDWYREHGDEIDARGGVALQVMNHSGDASKASSLVAERWNAPCYVHRGDADEVKRVLAGENLQTFVRSHRLCEDVEAIYVPSHSLGFTCFVWTCRDARFLFSSHLITKTRKGWGAAFVHPLLLETGLASLEQMRTLEVAYLLPTESVGAKADEGAPPIAFGAPERKQAIDFAVRHIKQAARRFAERKGIAVDDV